MQQKLSAPNLLDRGGTMKNIAVIYGGKSLEREVSLRSGAGVIAALKRLGYNVRGIDFESIDFIYELEEIDLVFLALHGIYGEDGRIQSVLDIMGMPYVGSGVLASSLAMDKSLSKLIFKEAGIRTAPDYLAKRKDTIQQINEQVRCSLSYPIVVKPNLEGSSIGLSFVDNEEELIRTLESTFTDYDELLLEECVTGREVTVAVIEDSEGAKALPIIEIIPNLGKYYNYDSKYAAGGSEHIVPAEIEPEQAELLKNWALAAFNKIGCRSFARVDFIIPDDGTDPVILEINTLPGMTETSLVPDAAQAIGLSYDQLVDLLVETAFSRA